MTDAPSVRFGGQPLHDPSPYFAANIPLDCNLCTHDIRAHTFLYTLGTNDLYRCTKRGCECGAKAEIRGIELAGNPTEEEVAKAMLDLAGGGGIVVRP